MLLATVGHNWFPLWSLPFWLLTLAVVAAVAFLAESRRGGYATLLLVGFLAAIHLLGDATLHRYAWEHWTYIPLGAVAWYVLGVGWSFIRWASELRMHGDRIEDDKDNWIRDYRSRKWDPVTGDPKTVSDAEADEAWRTWARCQRPLAKDNKSLIITWMSYWPVSLVWTLGNDPIRRGFDYAYREVAHIFENMSKNHWKRFDAPNAEEEAK